MKPLQQGELDGLCGVYAVINAIRFLVPKARDLDFCNKLMIRIVGDIYTAKDVTGGGGELKMTRVFEYARAKTLKDLKVGLTMSNKGRADRFKSPCDAMEATFNIGRPGVFIMGFDGIYSHWTIVAAVTKSEVLLFDSCGLKQFRRSMVIWNKHATAAGRAKQAIVAPCDLNWISV
jgi:hypothetical protein